MLLAGLLYLEADLNKMSDLLIFLNLVVKLEIHCGAIQIGPLLRSVWTGIKVDLLNVMVGRNGRA